MSINPNGNMFNNQLRSTTMQEFYAPQAFADPKAPQYVPTSYSDYAPPEIVQPEQGSSLTNKIVKGTVGALAAMGVLAAGRKYTGFMNKIDLEKPVKEMATWSEKIMYYPAKIGQWTLDTLSSIKNKFAGKADDATENKNPAGEIGDNVQGKGEPPQPSQTTEVKPTQTPDPTKAPEVPEGETPTKQTEGTPSNADNANKAGEGADNAAQKTEAQAEHANKTDDAGKEAQQETTPEPKQDNQPASS